MSDGNDQGPTAEARQPTPAEDAETTTAEPSAFMPEPGEQKTADLPKPKRGHKIIVYRGAADVVRHGEYAFRPDQPAQVPSDVAEELLTLPFESFETFEAIEKE